MKKECRKLLRNFLTCTLTFTAPFGCERFRENHVVGSGSAKSERRAVGRFDEIQLSGTGRLEITIGELRDLEVTGDDNLLPLIRTEVTDDGRLTIKPDQPMQTKTELVVKARVPNIKVLQCDGAVEASLTGVVNSRLSIEARGAAEVIVSGESDNFEVAILGTGEINAGELRAKSVEIRIDGAGEAYVHALDTLKVTIRGAGTVRYSGDPNVEKQVFGLGTVTKK